MTSALSHPFNHHLTMFANKKSIIFGAYILSCLILPGAPKPPSVSDKPLSKPLTHEQLLERQNQMRKRMSERDAVRFDPAELKQRKKKERGDIISRSTILSYGRTWTIVPKGSVLHIPSFLKARVDGAKSKRFVSWKDFYESNRGWIHLQNVKMQQARGKEAMPEGAVDAYPEIGRVVVAVCHGGPISVVPPKEEVEGDPQEGDKAEVVSTTGP